MTEVASSPFAADPFALTVIERMRRVNPGADPLAVLPDVHPARIPRHIAIIMDGNGRWAQERGFPRIFGHRNGAISVRNVVEECGTLGIEALTLYSFSLENWKRPSDEVSALMDLCVAYCEGERDALVEHGIRFKVIGRREGLPENVRRALRSVEEATAAVQGPTLCIALNYGSRAEITDAVRAIAQRVERGELKAADVSEDLLETHLYTAGLPDPDLLIRTAGELRLSNFLLWQLSYAEIYVTSKYWPDFGAAELHQAIRAYAQRTRRFGAVADERASGAGSDRSSTDEPERDARH